MGPTNPVPGYTPAEPVRITPPAAGDTSVENIVNPETVNRTDNRPERQDTGDAANAAKFNSNFTTFLQRLRDAQMLPETFMRVLVQGTQVSSGIQTGFAANLAEFMQFLSMDESQLLDFLKNQFQSGARFSGPLFEVLRQAFSQSQSPVEQNDIIRFVRQFSDYSSTQHLEQTLEQSLEEMSQSLPRPWSTQVSDILAKFQSGVSYQDREGNLKLLKDQLFPLIARYVSLTHDHGNARSILSTMMLDMARYENGSKQNMLMTLRSLSLNGTLPKELAKLSDEELERLLKNSDFFKSSESNTFADRLANLTRSALKGEGGAETQETFRNIMSAVLTNESVYMPLQHIMVPMEMNGNLMFSELWVDPDADRERGQRQSSANSEKTLRVLIKMDVSSLGAFDILINSRKTEGVSLSIACPESAAPFLSEMSEAVSKILTRNGLKVAGVDVRQMQRPMLISEAFPKIFGGVNSVNVRI